MYLPARSTDPDTSREAAEYIVSSGKASYQETLTAAAVRKWPGRTSLELSKVSGHCRFLLARRLGSVEDQGLVYRGPARKCAISDRKAATWYPVEPGQQLELVA